jgi:hypothetical protein
LIKIYDLRFFIFKIKKGFNNVTVPILSNKFEKRIGALGTATTRIFYILFVNGQQALSYFDPPPGNSSIEYEFFLQGSDLRIYKSDPSIAKSLLASIYVKIYPLNPPLRQILSDKISQGIQLLTYLVFSNQIHANESVNVLYYELYYGQSEKSFVSRVYYSVRLFFSNEAI